MAAYLPLQFVGGVAGAVLANLMFDLQAISFASTDRSEAHLLPGEVVATAGLVALVFGLAHRLDQLRQPRRHGGAVAQ